MANKIIIINGPNLNLLGKREINVYGNESFDTFFPKLENKYTNIKLEYFQSNSESSIIDKIHDVGYLYDGIILNAGAYSHTSIAIADAIAAITTPVVEVHISNIYKRETFRHHSFLSASCLGTVVGLGLDGYRLALEYFINSKK